MPIIHTGDNIYYKDYAMWKRHEQSQLKTEIVTDINKHYTICSAYRDFGGELGFSWETMLFKDGHLEKQYDDIIDSERVIDLHCKIIEKLKCGDK